MAGIKSSRNEIFADTEVGVLMLNFQTLFEAIPGLYLILAPDLTIVAISNAYLLATRRKPEEILGRLISDAYPDNPDNPNATGVENLRASLESVLKYKTPDTMAVQKYNIRRAETAIAPAGRSPARRSV